MSPKSFSRRAFLIKSAASAGALTGAAALLDACGAGGSSGTTTVNVMYQSNEFSKAQVAAFNAANSSIKINFIEFDGTRLAASVAAGNPPDFVRVLGALDIPNLVTRGLATNLDSYFTSSSVLQANDLGDITNVYRFSSQGQGTGPRYGMVKDWSQDLTYWYNKKLFDQAGVPYPSATTPMTYDELLDVGKRLTVRNGDKIDIYGLGALWGTGMQGCIMQMVAQQGGSIFSDDLTKADYTTPEARKALQWYVDWTVAKVGNGPLVTDASSGAFTAFPADRLAIQQFGFWFGGSIFGWDSIQDHIGLAPAPVMGNTRVSACLSAAGAYIPSGAKNKDAAWKVMEYFMAGQPAIDRAKSGFGLPALKSLYPDVPQGKPYQQEAYQTQQNEIPFLKTLKFSPYISDNSATNAIVNMVTGVAQGQTSFDDGVKNLNSTINLLLEQGQEQA